MNLRRIKHMLLRLSPEERMVGAGGLLAIFGTFMPWYSVVLNFDKKSLSYSGFGGDLGVIGFIIFLMVLIATLILVSEQLHIKLPQFGYRKEQAIFFLMGQSAFLILLTIAIYTKRSLDFTNAELRFGLYLALIGAFFGAFAAFAQMQKLKTKEVEKFFDHPEVTAKNEPTVEAQDPAPEEVGKVEAEPEPEPETIEEISDEEDIPLDDSNQEGEATLGITDEELEEEAEGSLEDEDKDEDYVPEDDTIEDIKEVRQKEEELQNLGQGDYFTREAGVGAEAEPDEEPVEAIQESTEGDEEEDQKKDKNKGLSTDFYEDL